MADGAANLVAQMIAGLGARLVQFSIRYGRNIVYKGPESRL
jgi:hypothetical protein